MPSTDPARASAVVFAYHNVGAHCLRKLVAHGVLVSLVVTHADAMDETIWFESVAAVAAELGIPVVTPADPNTPDILRRIALLAPDFIFSFYYRRMLSPALLAVPARGALNIHGSLLPKYRGRAPVNWAVLQGEHVTGATLHYMEEKPDAGDIVAQTEVVIGPDDTAREVFDKVTTAAETTLDRIIPSLIDGTAPRRVQNLDQGSYFGGRRPEDGLIDWARDATTIHNLVRAVAPPYPGAFTSIGGSPARVLRTRVLDTAAPATTTPTLAAELGHLVAHCGGGGRLAIHMLELGGQAVDPTTFVQRFGPAPVALPLDAPSRA